MLGLAFVVPWSPLMRILVTNSSRLPRRPFAVEAVLQNYGLP